MPLKSTTPTFPSTTAVAMQTKRRKALRAMLGAALATALAVAALLALPARADAAEEVNRIVLRVNDEILTLHDYEERKAARLTALLSDPRVTDEMRQERLSQVGREIMQEMFRELLLESRAEQTGVRISDRDVNERIQQLRESQGIDTDAKMAEALAASGITLAQLTETTRRDLIYNEVIGREVTSQIEVGEEEVRAYYRNHPELFETAEKRRLEEIIVLEETVSDEDERKRLAEEIHLKLVSGSDFATVIEPYQKAGFTTAVIDLDWLQRDELGRDLADPAWELEEDGYTEPIAGRGGLHIIRLAELQPAAMRPFEEVQAQILSSERNKRYAKTMVEYFADLEEKAFVDEDLPPDAVGYQSLGGDYAPEDELEGFQGPLENLEEDEESAESEDDAESADD